MKNRKLLPLHVATPTLAAVTMSVPGSGSVAEVLLVAVPPDFVRTAADWTSVSLQTTRRL